MNLCCRLSRSLGKKLILFTVSCRRAALLILALFCLLPCMAKAEQGGFITLVNGTPYNWRISKQFASRMTWKFPGVITAGSTATMYVGWSDWGSPASQYGYVTFFLDGTDQSFQLAADAFSGRHIRVLFTHLSTLGNPQGTMIDLGWQTGGYVNFILSGVVDSFTSSKPPDAWMHESLNIIGNRSLQHLTIPGSHDSGMSVVGIGTLGARECNVKTQVKSVLDQLHSGVRYFDIRPVISHGGFYTGHYSDTGKIGWQGANGQSLNDIIDDVNIYTEKQQELVVLYLSHDRNTDDGGPLFPLIPSYPAFTRGEWCQLLSQLTRLKNRFAVPNPTTVDLTKLTLGSFISKGPAVVVVVSPDNPAIRLDNLGCSAPPGFYKAESFPVIDRYAGTDQLDTMQENQLTKLQLYRPSPDTGYFLLSWTLTQTSAQATSCPLVSSILDLAAGANPFIYQNALPASNYGTYPNILYIDRVESNDIAALALAVSRKASWDKPRPYVIYQGLDNSIYVSSGQNLTRMDPAIKTSATPAAISFAGNIYVLYKGPGTDARIYIAHSDGGNTQASESWISEPLISSISTSTTPGLAVLRDKLYMLYKGSGNDPNIYIASHKGIVGDGDQWTAARLNPQINTSAAPAVAVLNDDLYLFYKGAGGDPNIYIAHPPGGDILDGPKWQWFPLNKQINTTEAPGVVTYNGNLYLFYRGFGSDSNIYVARSSGGDFLNGASWSFARLNPGINTTAAPKPLVVGGSLFLLYKGLENYIWVAKPQGDVFDGNAWQWQPLNPSITTNTGPGGTAI